MDNRNPTLGTLLRHLLDLLDGDVQKSYDAAALPYRPRYTPVVKALSTLGDASVRAIAHHARMTHSAVSQTVAQMVQAGLVEQAPGRDGRERIVSAAPMLRDMLPTLTRLWASTNRAADGLDAELAYPLSRLASEAIAVLEARSFAERIAQAQEHEA